MLALDLCEHEGARDPVENVRRGRAASPLLEPCVPGGTDVGPLRHFLAPQAGRAAALRAEAERRWIELRPPVLQIEGEPVLARDGSVHPVSHYNRISSLLYYNNPKDEACL
jgi:hypothetical protein